MEKDKQRREVFVSEIWIYFAIPLVSLIVLIIGTTLICIYTVVKFYQLLLPFLILLYFILKYLAIGSVLMYKAFMKMEVRNRCRFEPSCSTYMILAIQKYGLFRGVYKGIKRIRRCKPPNGGIDYP